MPGATYDVEGGAELEAGTSSSSPFGSYSKMASPVPHPPVLKHKRIPVIKKTIPIITLSTRDDGSRSGSSRSNKLVYNIVTQVIVSINSSLGECSVNGVANLVKVQTGFDPILLDSKLFPIMDSEATTGTEFWKSTRKIMAASKSLYEKLGGVIPEFNETDTQPTPSKKAKVADLVRGEHGSSRSEVLEDIDEKLLEIKMKLNSLDLNVGFLKPFQKSLECIICHGVVKEPVDAVKESLVVLNA